MTTPTRYTTTIYRTADGIDHDALHVSWATVRAILGTDHHGEPDEDARLIAALQTAGAPAWVAWADGWVDERGWGLIGPDRAQRLCLEVAALLDGPDDGTNDLRVIVDEVLHDDPQVTAEAIADIVREARADWALERERERDR